MAPSRAPETTEESTYAVVVDPAHWERSTAHLVAAIRTSFEGLDEAAGARLPDQVEARLREGPTTVAEGLRRGDARTLLAALVEKGVGAKLSRRRTLEASKAGQQPAAESSRRPRRPGPMPTLMEGWKLSLEPATGPSPSAPEPTASPREPSAGPPDPGDPERFVGWGDVLAENPTGHAERPASSAETLNGPSDPDPKPGQDEPAPAPGGSADLAPPVATARPVDDAPAPSDRVGPAGGEPTELPEPAARLASLGLPGRRVPEAELMPRLAWAGLLSVLAPGAGQVYLGRDDEARHTAMSAPLIVPWVRSVGRTLSEAHAVREGRRSVRSRPRLLRALGFTGLFWGVIILLGFGSVWIYRTLTTPTAPASEMAISASPDTGTGTPPDEPQSVDPTPAESSALTAEVHRREREAQARRLVLEASQACDGGDHARCAELSQQARQLDPSLHQAVRLFHRARLALEANPPGSGLGTELGTGCRPDDEECP